MAGNSLVSAHERLGALMKSAIIVSAVVLVCACGRSDAQNQTAASGAAGTPVLAAAGAAPSAPFSPPRALPHDAVVLQRVSIDDNGVIARGRAMTGLIPSGWTARGGVVPQSNLCAEPYAFNWTASSPDGMSTVSLFPTEIWQGSNSGLKSDCPNANWSSVRDYLAARIAATVPGARILDYRDRPDFAEGAKPVAAMREQMFNQVGAGKVRIWVEGGETLYAFNQNGVEMRGVMGVAAMFNVTQMENPMAASPQFDPLGGQPIIAITGSILGTFAATAPNGQLNLTTIEAVRRSFTPDPRWLNSLFNLAVKLGEINAQATSERAAIIIAGGAAATRSNIAAYEAMAGASIANSNASIEAQRPRGGGEIFPGDAAGDRMQRESIEAIRGVETYRDPIDGYNVQLDANYDHAWRVNNNDTYILTKDPNFNPGQYGIEATQMGAVR